MPNDFTSMKSVEYMQQKLEDWGYRYFLLTDMESSDKHGFISYYTVYKSVEGEQAELSPFEVQSEKGATVIAEMLTGSAIIHLHQGYQLYVNCTGKLIRKEILQLLN